MRAASHRRVRPVWAPKRMMDLIFKTLQGNPVVLALAIIATLLFLHFLLAYVVRGIVLRVQLARLVDRVRNLSRAAPDQIKVELDGVFRKSQAEFACTGCGHRDNADVNAANNILAAGLAVTGRGGHAVGRPEKRQPSERQAA